MLAPNIVDCSSDFEPFIYEYFDINIPSPVVPGRCRKKRKIVVANDVGNPVEFEALYHGPRVMKSDIRLSFATMFTNVMNSGDFPLTFGFLDTFCARPFAHRFSYPGKHCLKYFTRNGVAETAKFMGYTIFMIPDLVCRILSAAVYSADDGKSSRVECNYRLEGTKIFSDDRRDEDVAAVGSIQDIYQSVERHMTRFSRLEHPYAFKSDGRWIFYLDEHKRIVRCEMDALVFYLS